MINLEMLFMLSIRSSHGVIILGVETCFAWRMLGAPEQWAELHLLLQLSADKIIIGAKLSVPGSVKLLPIHRSARLCTWVLEGSRIYQPLEVG